jgi:hypothetical protein
VAACVSAAKVAATAELWAERRRSLLSTNLNCLPGVGWHCLADVSLSGQHGVRLAKTGAGLAAKE